MKRILLVLLLLPLFVNHSTSQAREGNFVSAGIHKISIKEPLNVSLPASQSVVEALYIAPPVEYVLAQSVTNCGSDPYMAQIYTRESGCSTTRTNSIGCLGLGQACPGSKLLAVCPTMDWNCENNFFTNYANVRYGGPAQAWAVWQSQSWW